MKRSSDRPSKSFIVAIVCGTVILIIIIRVSVSDTPHSLEDLLIDSTYNDRTARASRMHVHTSFFNYWFEFLGDGKVIIREEITIIIDRDKTKIRCPDSETCLLYDS